MLASYTNRIGLPRLRLLMPFDTFSITPLRTSGSISISASFVNLKVYASYWS